jgi:hypothetical protein
MLINKEFILAMSITLLLWAIIAVMGVTFSTAWKYGSRITQLEKVVVEHQIFIEERSGE